MQVKGAYEYERLTSVVSSGCRLQSLSTCPPLEEEPLDRLSRERCRERGEYGLSHDPSPHGQPYPRLRPPGPRRGIRRGSAQSDARRRRVTALSPGTCTRWSVAQGP